MLPREDGCIWHLIVPVQYIHTLITALISHEYGISRVPVPNQIHSSPIASGPSLSSLSSFYFYSIRFGSDLWAIRFDSKKRLVIRFNSIRGWKRPFHTSVVTGLRVVKFVEGKIGVATGKRLGTAGLDKLAHLAWLFTFHTQQLRRDLNMKKSWLPEVNSGCFCCDLETCCKVQGYFCLVRRS